MPQVQRGLRALLHVLSRCPAGAGRQRDLPHQDKLQSPAEKDTAGHLQDSGGDDAARVYDLGFLSGGGGCVAGGGLGDDTSASGHLVLDSDQAGGTHCSAPAGGLGRRLGQRHPVRYHREPDTGGRTAADPAGHSGKAQGVYDRPDPVGGARGKVPCHGAVLPSPVRRRELRRTASLRFCVGAVPPQPVPGCRRFIGTGNVFRKDGKVYHIPKAYQRVQAQRSGLSYPPGDTSVPMQKRCRTCQRRFRCNGCHWCGKCENEEGGNS